MTMEAVSYSLRQTVFGILKTLVVRASQNNLDLTYDVEPDIPDQLIGDSLHLRQVITNLVGNAIKFTPSKSSHKGHGEFEHLRYIPIVLLAPSLPQLNCELCLCYFMHHVAHF